MEVRVLVQVLVFDGADELDVVAPFEVLTAAARAVDDRSEVRLVAVDAPREVTMSHGLTVAVAHAPAPEGTVLVVPGGGWMTDRADSVRGEVERGVLPSWLATAADGHDVVASVCTGAMLLEAAGMLDGRRAVTHASAMEDLAARGVTVVDQRVVDDGDVVTAGGVTSGIDLALHLVARLWGAEVAEAERVRLEHPAADATG